MFDFLLLTYCNAFCLINAKCFLLIFNVNSKKINNEIAKSVPSPALPTKIVRSCDVFSPIFPVRCGFENMLQNNGIQINKNMCIVSILNILIFFRLNKILNPISIVNDVNT